MNKLPTANKELGQHFLISEKVIDAITTDFIEKCDVIVEVGPGPAILSKKLSQHKKPYYVIEKDSRFLSQLETVVDKENIFIEDALNFNWQNFVNTYSLNNKDIWLVSNLPYNVGTVLFTNFLSIKEIKYMSLMFQKEVGDKTYFRQGKNQMNGLLFQSLNYFDSNKLIKVSPGCFSPPPKVESVVVSYKRKSLPDISIDEYKILNTFTRALFSMKRKQIGTVLKRFYDKAKLDMVFSTTQIDPRTRAETLSYDQVLTIYKNLSHD